MQTISLTTTLDPLYPVFKDLYKTSFPIFEQRTEEQQKLAFSKDQYHLDCYQEENRFIGFIGYWRFKDYIYIEHFAIDTTLRGKGYGSTVLKNFIQEKNKRVLLEIDPVTDPISAARLRFYQACGFYPNVHIHTHPPYRKGFTPHSLIVLTTRREISKEEYNRFYTDLKEIVMV
ncbi:GNAT family N-acetyltransferase [Parabacteroides pacaensis]|uniref:GNAT family N-acetyltransferase n=1 Tax=Parabacteroides pacaensis TaxID=2086575 RepID=UPI000D0E491A|nr:GNAT family N-acetyltransferase [Parabacteroides pacaensis]